MMINTSIKKLFQDKVWIKMVEVSTRIFEEGKKEGLIKDIDNYFLQKALFGMLFYTIIVEQVLNVEESKYSSREQAEKIVKILFEGIERNVERGN